MLACVFNIAFPCIPSKVVEMAVQGIAVAVARFFPIGSRTNKGFEYQRVNADRSLPAVGHQHLGNWIATALTDPEREPAPLIGNLA